MVERGEQLGFVDETAQAEHEGFAMALRAHRNAAVAAALRQVGRHVLLERDDTVQPRVARKIDDAETALADQPFDHVLLQRLTDGQGGTAAFARLDDGARLVGRRSAGRWGGG